ncbi:MAG: hypothetical protein HC833_24260 [Leptolyngbyaceae cyanobacterium RM1_406_9]|nr:hypothetical protein [Leptolyngbyaceae cyanobacterium RM1_406_9]
MVTEFRIASACSDSGRGAAGDRLQSPQARRLTLAKPFSKILQTLFL